MLQGVESTFSVHAAHTWGFPRRILPANPCMVQASVVVSRSMLRASHAATFSWPLSYDT